MTQYQKFSETEQAVLKARAERVASSLQNTQVEHLYKVLVVKVHGESYALPIDTITAVYENIPIIPVPCVPPFAAGIANLRGHIVPVLDLAVILGFAPQPAQAIQPLVVIATTDWHLAFCVGQIEEVIALPARELLPVPATVALSRPEFVQGTWTNGTIYLNTHAILSDPTLIVDESFG
jgi:purine-binding chemotaxis protein CheW